MQLRAEIRWPVNLKQMYDQQITYLSSNQRRTHKTEHKSVGVLIVSHFFVVTRDVTSDVYRGSTISSANFLWQRNNAHKSWPTLSIVWQPLND